MEHYHEAISLPGWVPHRTQQKIWMAELDLTKNTIWTMTISVGEGVKFGRKTNTES